MAYGHKVWEHGSSRPVTYSEASIIMSSLYTQCIVLYWTDVTATVAAIINVVRCCLWANYWSVTCLDSRYRCLSESVT